MLLQLTSDQPERLYESAESLFYVIAGEGVIGIDGKETRLVAGVLASVPRATSFTIGRRGRNPLILLAILSGEPCEEAK
jgi:mannose-6-phosphate isomerase-like protein (cupin superfamily)